MYKAFHGERGIMEWQIDHLIVPIVAGPFRPDGGRRSKLKEYRFERRKSIASSKKTKKMIWLRISTYHKWNLRVMLSSTISDRK